MKRTRKDKVSRMLRAQRKSSVNEARAADRAGPRWAHGAMTCVEFPIPKSNILPLASICPWAGNPFLGRESMLIKSCLPGLPIRSSGRDLDGRRATQDAVVPKSQLLRNGVWSRLQVTKGVNKTEYLKGGLERSDNTGVPGCFLSSLS